MATQARRKQPVPENAVFKNHVFRDFGGINTQAKRQAIKAEEFAWIENIMPVGHGNAIIVPARSGVLATVTSGNCYSMQDYNLGGANYMFMACDDGTAYQVALASPFTRTLIGSGFSTSGLETAQWENNILIIVDPVNGYFTWDGTVLFKNGSLISATVTAGGSYTTIPTWTVSGGGGAGGAVSSVMELAGTQTISTAGASYVAGDVVTLVGGTFSAVGRLTVLTVNGGGGVTSVSILDAGSYTVLGSAPLSVTGGAGNGLTITPLYDVLSLTVTNGGTIPYVTPPTLTVSSGAATATATLQDGPPAGQHVATFSGRAWVSNNRTLNYSVPGSYSDFSGTGSGLTIISDATLHSNITQLISANNFLYFTGVDSANVIGDVTVNANGDTVFSNTNLSASVGTDLSATLIPYFRSIWFSNRAGVYSLYGSTPSKTSDALDGIFRAIDFTKPISGAQVMLENILCAAFLVQYIDPVQRVTRPIICIFFNRKWFIGSQGNDLLSIASGEQNGIQQLYGTDGKNLYQLFADPDTAVDWLLETAFWDMGDVTAGKEANAFGFECDLPSINGQITFNIDVLNNQPPNMDSQRFDVSLSGLVTWINNLDQPVTWENNALALVDWSSAGYFMNLQDTSIDGGTIFGKYLGVTMQSSDTTGSLSSIMLRYIFREQW